MQGFENVPKTLVFNADVATVGLLAKDRPTMMAGLLDFMSAHGLKDGPIDVTMPCGTVTTFDSHDCLPYETMPCPCGDPKHLVVEYREI